MTVAKNSLLIHNNHHVEVPREKPSCGVQPEIVHTINNIRYHLIFVWLKNKSEFWFFPISNDGISLYGYGWNQRSWIKIKIKIDSVKSYYY